MWPTDFTQNFLFGLRWLHFLAGITWIGLLYFFNLVNVPFMKEIDPPTKLKVVPSLMPRALFWFRWGAMVTVIVGLTYHLRTMSTPGEYEAGVLRINSILWWWLLVVMVAFTVGTWLMTWFKSNGLALWIAYLLLIVAMTVILWKIHAAAGASWRILSISIGGGMGIIMFMNVWMIIWPLQKKIIAAAKAQAESGAAPPAEMPAWARRAFLASRANAWLSVPLLFFMGAASHFSISVGK